MNYLLTRHSRDSMIMLIDGESMCPEIQDGDHVVVAFDREPKPGDIVIAKLNGGYTIKRLKLNNNRGKSGLYLVPSNPEIPVREIIPVDDYIILGVVTYIIHPTVY